MTDEEFEEVLSAAFSEEEAAVIRLQREQLKGRGIRDPALTRMACEFAEVLLAGRGKRETP